MDFKLYFSDFDGTLTHGHVLKSLFFDILNEIHSKKAELIIVSGRSVSWGHFFISHLPMPFAIMEGGGVIVKKNKHGLLEEEFLVSKENLNKLENIATEVISNFPMLSLSVDSAGRKTDRAIELRSLEDETIMREVKSLFDEKGVHYSQSNVHLNFWYGEISKYETVKYLVEKYFPAVDLDETVFFGDSLNDESMFKHLKHTVGVSNISNIISKLKYRPHTILEGPINEGPYGVLNFLRNTH
ncbi:MAG: HAD family phosphatase [Halobacteriovoraceae bacterium]|nr:HAD family phosphatase [Halobacteriovoraceae bacterium]